MATRLRRRLTDTQIEKAKPDPTKQILLQDGEGLYLEINSSGSKIWRMKATLQGKAMRLSFGKYPAISLVHARKQCEEAHSLITQGIDPREAKKAAIAAKKADSDNLALPQKEGKC